MDMLEYLMNNGSVLDGSVIARFMLLSIILQFFGIVTYWLPRMNGKIR